MTDVKLLPLVGTLRAMPEHVQGVVQAYAHANVAHAVAPLQAEIEALRAEMERANSWNERVSVCRDHVADIVDGPCVICALGAAQASAERLAELLDQAYGHVPAGALADQIHCALLRFALTIADATLSKENRND